MSEFANSASKSKDEHAMVVTIKNQNRDSNRIHGKQKKGRRRADLHRIVFFNILQGAESFMKCLLYFFSGLGM